MAMSNEGGGSISFFNVKEGRFVNKKSGESYNTCSGIISGIRSMKSEYEGQTYYNLEILILDPDDGSKLVLSSGLWTLHRDKIDGIGTFSRMFIERMVKATDPGEREKDEPRKLEKGDAVRIGVYIFEGGIKPANCCAMSFHGDDPQKPMPKWSGKKLCADSRNITTEELKQYAVELSKLEELYGTFENKDAANDAPHAGAHTSMHDTPPPDYHDASAPPPTEPHKAANESDLPF